MLFALALGFGVPLTGYDDRTWAALLALGSFPTGAAAWHPGSGLEPPGDHGFRFLSSASALASRSRAVPLPGQPLDLSIITGGILILGGIGLATRG